MSLSYIVANSSSNVVMQASRFPVTYNDKLCFCTVLDSTHTGVKDLLTDKSSHLFSDIMTEQYINVQYDNTNIVGKIINPSVNPQSTANISILDTAIQVPIINNQFTLPITIHESVIEQKIEVSIQVDGCPPCYMEIGESNGNISLQMYQDGNGTYQIIPEHNEDLAAYWQNKYVNDTWNTVDFETAIGILFDAMFNYIFPALQNTSYTPLSLSSAELNGLNDIKTNVLSQIASKLANIQPDANTSDIHYASYRAHIANANQAMSGYITDRTEILKYTTLK